MLWFCSKVLNEEREKVTDKKEEIKEVKEYLVDKKDVVETLQAFPSNLSDGSKWE